MLTTAQDVLDWAEIPPGAVDPLIVQAVLDGEQAAQALACRVPFNPAELPADLRLALLRRCARTLAARDVPLGVITGLGDGSSPSTLANFDAETRRLEKPHRRLFAG